MDHKREDRTPPTIKGHSSGYTTTTKLRKMRSTKYNAQLIKIELAICDSQFKQKLNEVSIAVAKIKSDTNIFFRYAK